MIAHIMGDIIPSSYAALVPELYLCVCAMALLLYGVYRSPKASIAMVLVSILILAVTAGLESAFFENKTVAMNGMFITDAFSMIGKFIILAASAWALLLSADWLMEEKGRPFEFVVLVLLATLGMLLMVSANDFIAMYMALEMSSLSLYVLAAFTRDTVKSSEAGLKYFVLGALASGMMLFGMSLVYGFAGSTSFETLSTLFCAKDAVVSPGVVVGMVLVMVGLCFKVSAVPFHMWTPDVYEGAPTPVTAFFAIAPKAAALLLFTRVMMQPFGDLTSQWQQILVFVSLASMLVGALAGIMQSNIKRLLAYSSIGHVGFILMGLAAGNVAGVQAVLIYIALYIAMSAGAFGCVLLMKRDGKYVEDIKDFAGMAQTHPARALFFSAFLFSMAGIPPLAGFFGKMYAVIAAVDAGFAWLAAVGVLTSVISGYYYIKVVKVMYFDEPTQPVDGKVTCCIRASVFFSSLVTLLFFLTPTPLVALAKLAAEALLK